MINVPDYKNVVDTIYSGLSTHILALHSAIKIKNNLYKEDEIFYNNERFYQYLSVFNFVQNYDHKILLDKYYTESNSSKQVDLQILDESGQAVFLAEYKRWWSSKGVLEIPKFLSDIEALRKFKIPKEKAFIVFTIHNKSNRESNIKELGNILSFDNSMLYYKGFDLDKEFIFDIISYKV